MIPVTCVAHSASDQAGPQAPPPAADRTSYHCCRRAATATGLFHRSWTVKVVGIFGQEKRCRVVWLCDLHSGHAGVWYVLGSIALRYVISIGDLLARNCACVYVCVYIYIYIYYIVYYTISF